MVSLSGVAVTAGNVGSSGYGAGILNYGTLTVGNCAVANNAAGSEGGGRGRAHADDRPVAWPRGLRRADQRLAGGRDPVLQWS